MKGKLGEQWNKIFMEIFRSMSHDFFASFSGVLDWIVLILVWFERSLHSAQVSRQSCPWPLKLMTSRRVERTRIHMGGYRRFRGKWVKDVDIWLPKISRASQKSFRIRTSRIWNCLEDELDLSPSTLASLKSVIFNYYKSTLAVWPMIVKTHVCSSLSV